MKYLAMMLIAGLTMSLADDAWAQDGKKTRLPGAPCVFADDSGKLLPQKAVAYALHERYDFYRQADTDCDGHLSPQEIADFEASKANEFSVIRRNVERAQKSERPIRIDPQGKSNVDPLLVDSAVLPKDKELSKWSFLLRDSAEDVGVWQAPKKTTAASGAALGYSSDANAGNVAWSAKGVASVVYRHLFPKPVNEQGLIGYALAPSISFDRSTNSNAAPSYKARQTDTLGFGGTAELGYGPLLSIAHYLRIRGSFNTDFELNPKSWSMTGEWQPVSSALGLSSPFGNGLSIRIDPMARVQTIRRINGATDPIFAQHDHVWRAGPVVSLTVQADKDELGWLEKGYLLQRIEESTLNVSYSSMFDTYTGKNYYLFNTSLTVPVSEDSHAGLKFTYLRGYDDQTAVWNDKVTVGLALRW